MALRETLAGSQQQSDRDQQHPRAYSGAPPNSWLRGRRQQSSGRGVARSEACSDSSLFEIESGTCSPGRDAGPLRCSQNRDRAGHAWDDPGSAHSAERRRVCCRSGNDELRAKTTTLLSRHTNDARAGIFSGSSVRVIGAPPLRTVFAFTQPHLRRFGVPSAYQIHAFRVDHRADDVFRSPPPHRTKNAAAARSGRWDAHHARSRNRLPSVVVTLSRRSGVSRRCHSNGQCRHIRNGSCRRKTAWRHCRLSTRA